MTPDGALSVLIELSTAADHVYRAVQNRDPPDKYILDTMARMIAAKTRIFTCRGDSNTAALIMPDEVFNGQFSGGGTMLIFRDGRAPIYQLHIRRDDLPAV